MARIIRIIIAWFKGGSMELTPNRFSGSRLKPPLISRFFIFIFVFWVTNWRILLSIFIPAAVALYIHLTPAALPESNSANTAEIQSDTTTGHGGD